MLSVVIPTLNEVNKIDGIINFFNQFKDLEIIFSDGQSTDGTFEKLKKTNLKVIKSKAGRAHQMNRGGKIANGKYILFAHADCRFHEDGINYLINLSNDETNVLWGFFIAKLSNKKFIFRIIELFMNKRSQITNIATGDLGIFINKSLFNKINGFSNIRIMEDISISKKLRRISEPFIIKHVHISTRKWENHGILKTIFLMWHLRLYIFLDLISEKYIRSTMDKSKILIFSKFPEIRKVKSRLHPTLVMRKY